MAAPEKEKNHKGKGLLRVTAPDRKGRKGLKGKTGAVQCLFNGYLVQMKNLVSNLRSSLLIWSVLIGFRTKLFAPK
ncbi:MULTISPECIES: hypothetical protein [Citrobacter]|uniref:hypothetical protein n=1 Tax=Citrobacter sp. wls711 TaxID=2576425 RepID=UPI00148578C8|nr:MULTISPECIES: hypothetical protein [Citrobacter]WFZ85363.1 hypothetical protein NFK79_02320 [Citrobacter freundii]HEE0107375.1 hypothetical protein [Citrobacter gillenii]HEE0121616.1 hypothetical protein [Citrobacter gillenii]